MSLLLCVLIPIFINQHLVYKFYRTDYWEQDSRTWGKLNDWDVYWIKKQQSLIEKQQFSVPITKQNSHSALADELRNLKQIYTNAHPAYNKINSLQKEMKESTYFW